MPLTGEGVSGESGFPKLSAPPRHLPRLLQVQQRPEQIQILLPESTSGKKSYCQLAGMALHIAQVGLRIRGVHGRGLSFDAEASKQGPRLWLGISISFRKKVKF